MPTRIVIMGAAGRDFHNFNIVFREDARAEVVAFTATQIPDIEGRSYPPRARRAALPEGHPDPPRGGAARPDPRARGRPGRLRLQRRVARVRDAQGLARRSPRARTSGCSAPNAHHAHGRASRWSPSARCAPAAARARPPATWRALLRERGQPGRRRPPPDAVRRPREAGGAALRRLRGPRPARVHDRGARGVRAAHRRGRRRLRRRGLRGDPARRPRRRPTSSSGTAATTTCRSTGPTSRSSSPIRTGRATSCRYHPGETNLRRADVVVINKIDTAGPEGIEAVRRRSGELNPARGGDRTRPRPSSWTTPSGSGASACS